MTLGPLLPTFTAAQKALIKGSCDFYAIDAYTSYTATGSENADCYTDATDPGWPECAPSSQKSSNGFPMGPSSDPGASWLKNTPYGIRMYLSHITKVLFPKIPDIVVSEFGFAEPFESQIKDVGDVLWDLRRAVRFPLAFPFSICNLPLLTCEINS
jgi:hypothetical protein